MGFAHALKLDKPTGERACAALLEFGKWARQDFVKAAKALPNDTDAQEWLRNSPDGWDWTGLSAFWLIEDADEILFENPDDPSGLIRQRDMAAPDEVPCQREVTIRWVELRPNRWTAKSWQKLYEVLQDQDALTVWEEFASGCEPEVLRLILPSRN